MRSQDLVSAVLLLGGMASLLAYGGSLWEWLADSVRVQLSGRGWRLESAAPAEMTDQFWDLIGGAAPVLLPVLCLPLLTVVAVHWIQGGIRFLPHKAAPDLNRVDPRSGTARVVSGGGMRLGMGVFKVVGCVTIAIWCLYDWRADWLALSSAGVERGVVQLAGLVVRVGLAVGTVLLVLSLLDYAYQRWAFEKELRMSDQQLREEMRGVEGDPQVAAQRRKLRRDLATGRLAAIVPRAQIVIVAANVAVALTYEPGSMQAPRAVAKGTGAQAHHIRTLARQHSVRIVESRDVANRLADQAEVNRPIPEALYQETAELLIAQ